LEFSENFLRYQNIDLENDRKNMSEEIEEELEKKVKKSFSENSEKILGKGIIYS
jgi:hypothetical protein